MPGWLKVCLADTDRSPDVRGCYSDRRQSNPLPSRKLARDDCFEVLEIEIEGDNGTIVARPRTPVESRGTSLVRGLAKSVLTEVWYSLDNRVGAQS